MKLLFLFSIVLCLAQFGVVQSGKRVTGGNGKSYYLSYPMKVSGN